MQITNLNNEVIYIKGEIHRVETLLSQFEAQLGDSVSGIRLKAQETSEQLSQTIANVITASKKIFEVQKNTEDKFLEVKEEVLKHKEMFDKMTAAYAEQDKTMKEAQGFMAKHNDENLTRVNRLNEYAVKQEEERKKLENGLSELYHMSTQGTNEQTGKQEKSLLESKAIGNLKTLGDNKGMFREWNDKLNNAINEARKGARGVLNWVEKQPRNKEITEANYESSECTTPYGEISESLYAVLIDKTEGEARQRVNAGKQATGWTDTKGCLIGSQ